MSHTNEKEGARVNLTERATESQSSRPGLGALRAIGRRQENSARSSRARRRDLLLISAALSTVLLLAVAAPAFACETPQISSQLRSDFAFATRAHIEAQAVITNGGSPPEASWHAEYAPAEAGGAPPPAGSPSWKIRGAGTFQLGRGELFLTEGSGEQSNQGFALLRYLTPASTYYARFHIEDECGADEKTFKFTTTPISKPGIFGGVVGGDVIGAESFVSVAFSPTKASFRAIVESNGAETTYRFEYAPADAGGARPAETSSSWHLFSSGEATGTVAAEPFESAAGFAEPKAGIAGLSPETTYYVRVRAENGVGEAVQTKYNGGQERESFTTPTAKPIVPTPQIRNVTGVSAHLVGSINPHQSETEWRFEYTTDPANQGSWAEVPGAAGNLSQTQAESLPEGTTSLVGGDLTGLSPSTTYYVRLFAENEAGEALVCFARNHQTVCEPVSTASGAFASFETAGPPSAITLPTHALHGEAIRLLGAVDPNSVPTSAEQTIAVQGAPTGGSFTLTFKGQQTSPISYPASSTAVKQALEGLPSHPQLSVEGVEGGPYVVFFGGPDTGLAEPAITADGSGLTPSGSVAVTVDQSGGEGYDTHHHFEYELEEEGVAPFAHASSTPAVDLGLGIPQQNNPSQAQTEYVGSDLPLLVPGATYRYRLSATNTSPGDPVVDGAAQGLTVPSPAPAEPPAACPNQALRTGPSAALPDCRAYEQITPVDKEGAQEIFRYEGISAVAYSLIGEDGEHVMLETPASLGSGPAAGQGPYLFSRDPSNGWQMTAAAAQPETGVDQFHLQLLTPDLTRLGFAADFSTSPGSGQSKDVEYKAGPTGGPYTTVAEVPRAQVPDPGGWVAASADFSKLVLSTEDRKLVKPQTTTVGGSDLYEYSTQAGLRQLDVGVGTCGAKMVDGNEEFGPRTHGQAVSPHALSADGSRVFFEATPGSNCSEPTHLYMRVDGSATIDFGAYRFAAANPQGTEFLLEKRSGENPGLYLYRTESGPPRFLASSGFAVGLKFTVSEDLTAVYALTGGGIYRYDIPSETLLFLFAGGPGAGQNESVSPDGRFYYFKGQVTGLPAGGLGPVGGHEEHNNLKDPIGPFVPTEQVYRYDHREGVVECMSCASPSNPEPKLDSSFGEKSPVAGPAGTPKLTQVSANGNFAFFQTPAALLPSDVDGEVIPEGTGGLGLEHASSFNSVSNDVYEWRRDGIDGCAHIQGCLALITDGRGGLLNELLGTADEGRDVFIFTHSQLLRRDNDTAGDVYDARIGGGFAEPEVEVECEGDSCFHPVPAPNDPTPSSSTYHGPGNEHPVKKHRKHRKHKKAKHKAKHRRAGANRGGPK